MSESYINIIINTFTPFFIFCFFILDSLIFNNIKGIIFLIGLSISLVISFLASNMLNITNNINNNKKCIPLTINNSSLLMNIPLTPNILFYTITSLLYSMLHNNFILANFTFIITISIIIIMNIVWLLQEHCFSTIQIVVSSLLGITTALLWNFILHKSNNKGYIYTLGLPSSQICQIPKRKTYKCKTK